MRSMASDDGISHPITSGGAGVSQVSNLWYTEWKLVNVNSPTQFTGDAGQIAISDFFNLIYKCKERRKETLMHFAHLTGAVDFTSITQC